MTKTKRFSKKFSLLTIFMLLMSIITMDVYATKLPFTDVPEKSWYYDDVKSAYESKLINGKKPTKYAPNDNMTAAEAVKLAAAMHMLKNQGAVKFSPSKPWYKVYVDYAKKKSLIKGDLTWNKKITRAGYMQIFAQILTDEEAKKNSVADGSIPDVPMTHPNAQAIYKLYRAGVVTGIDDKKNCAPASNIKRSEVAAILIRMMNPKRRLGFSLGKSTTPGTTTPPGGTTVIEEKELKITKQPENVKGKVGDIVRLEVMVEGGKQPYSYQWEYKNPKLPNFKNSIEKGNTTNVLEPPVESDVSFYRCVITDADGKKVTSNQARVDITTSAIPLKITKQPQDVKGKVGEILKLGVIVDGGKQPYSYQWQYKNPKLADFQNSIEKGNTTNVLEPPVESDISYYRCIITDADGDKVTSNTAKVEKKSSGVNIDDLIDPKIPLALKITKEPEDATGKVGETARLVVGVQGGRLPLRYQWQYTEYNYGKFQYTGIYQDSKAKGNTTAVLEPPIENDPCGYRCVITDADGYSVTSKMAEVKKKDDIEILPSPLKITRQPEKYKIVNDEPFEISLDATVLPGTIKYQWQRRAGGVGGWVDLTPSSKYQGADTNRMIVSDQGKGTVDFCCVVTSGSQKITSDICRTFNNPQGTAAGNKPPVYYYITQDVKGKSGTFTVKADGLPRHELKYQWKYHDDKPVPEMNTDYMEISGTNTPSVFYKVKGQLQILGSVKCVIRCERDGGQVETDILDLFEILGK